MDSLFSQEGYFIFHRCSGVHEKSLNKREENESELRIFSE